MLINNAGITCPGLPLSDLSENKIENIIDINLKANIFLVKYLHSYINNIININSMVGLEPKKNRSIYAASKFGLRGFSQSFNLEDISCNILDVYPTNIKTLPNRDNAMEVDFVLNKIYEAFISNHKELVIDGRPK